MSTELATGIRTHQGAFGLELADETIDRLDRYYGLLLEHNPILHLIGPMNAEEIAIRHVLESLALLKYMPANTRFADVGSGGGLPAIPCLLARHDLSAVLIESKEKKTKFLDTAVEELDLTKRVSVLTSQFSEVDPANCEVVTCRALDKFTERLGRLLKWATPRQPLLFGGPNLRDELVRQKVRFQEDLMPMSEQRLLFIVKN